MLTPEGASYLQFIDQSGKSYWTWAFGRTLESQLAGYKGLGDQTSGGQGSEKGDKKGKGKANYIGLHWYR